MANEGEHSGKPKAKRVIGFSRNSTKMRDRLQRKIHLVPGFITMVGIFCGFLAIISALNGKFEYAAKCIALSFILDGLDGRVARSLNATSDFGREFDSLSDLVSFGVAPAVLCYAWAFSTVADEFGILISFFFVVCAATRLARFNITTSGAPSSFFEGMPTPGAAAGIASLVYWHPYPLTYTPAIIASVLAVIFLGVLMVSTRRFLSIKNVKIAQGNSAINVILLAMLVALTWYHSRIVILILTWVYVLSGFVPLKLNGVDKSENEPEELSA